MTTRDALDWGKIPVERMDDLILTGWIAVDLLLDRAVESPLNVWAYTRDVEGQFPDGETTLLLRDPEQYPSSFPLAGFVIADFDRVIEDIRGSDPRGFQVALEEDEEFL